MKYRKNDFVTFNVTLFLAFSRYNRLYPHYQAQPEVPCFPPVAHHIWRLFQPFAFQAC